MLKIIVFEVVEQMVKEVIVITDVLLKICDIVSRVNVIGTNLSCTNLIIVSFVKIMTVFKVVFKVVLENV